MHDKQVKIKDVITIEYEDFLSYCAASGKEYAEEITNVDFVAFRTISGRSREYIQAIKNKLGNHEIAVKTPDTVDRVELKKSKRLI